MPILKTIPLERPALWGGTKLREYFHYPEFGSAIGQSWSFSGQEGQSTLIENGPYAGKSIEQLWRENPGLFASKQKQFPYIISLVAPLDDLSIQIHPNDTVARREGFAYGKNEAWYFLEAPEGAEIVYGHTAKDEQQLRAMIAQDRWSELVTHLPVRKGDFVYLPAGILHALRKDCIVYEIQQATDVTYRFFDYHRKDQKGEERPLHVEKAIACVDYSLGLKDAHPQPQTQALEAGTAQTLIRNESFWVCRWDIQGEQQLRFSGYQLFTVVAGTGMADDVPLEVGVNFLLPAGDTVCVRGQVTLMTTCEPQTVLLSRA